MLQRSTRLGLTLALGLNLLLMGLSLLIAPGSLAATTTVYVRPSALGNWSILDTNYAGTDTGDYDFVNGPATPPAGVGSGRFRIGSNGASYGGFHTAEFNGIKLADITKLEYSTYVSSHVDTQAPYLILTLDVDGNGSYVEDDPTTPDSDTRLFFEPTYQTGAYGGEMVPNQGALALNTWQTWNALSGGWWDNNVSGGPPLLTLATFAAAHPNAKLITRNGVGGLIVRAGAGEESWDNFVGNTDKVVVGSGANETIFDFEPDLIATTTKADNKTAVYSDPDVNLTAKVALASPLSSPVGTGNVDFKIKSGSTTLASGSGALDGSGNASATVGLTPLANFPAGTYTIRAKYEGSNTLAESADSATLTIAKAATKFTAVEGSGAYGDATGTVRARLKRTNGDTGWVIGGTVQFKVNGVPICGVSNTPNCPTTDNNGWAELATAPLPSLNSGTYTNAVTATFAGDANHNAAADKSGSLTIGRRILLIKATDRTVGLKQPNPPTTPPANCVAQQTATSACWLELAPGSAFVNGDDWGDLNLTNLRFTYTRNYPSSNASEYVGKTYKISATGFSSANYDLRFVQGTLTVVQP